MSAVAHNGCSPMPCRWRNGHHDTPHTKAFTSRASTGPAERGRGIEAVVIGCSMRTAARDLEKALDLRAMVHQVAAMPAPDQPAGERHEHAEDRDRPVH